MKNLILYGVLAYGCLSALSLAIVRPTGDRSHQEFQANVTPEWHSRKRLSLLTRGGAVDEADTDLFDVLQRQRNRRYLSRKQREG